MSETKLYKYEPDYAIRPGEILEETLEARGMKKVDLAQRCGLSAKTVSLILSGLAPVSAETALQLERTLGISANVWSNLEANYRLFKAKRASQQELGKYATWAKSFPIRHLEKKGVIEQKKTTADLCEELLNFFGVGSVSAWQAKFQEIQVCFKRSPSFQSSLEATSAWLRIGELRASQIDCKPYDKKNFKKALMDIRSLTPNPPNIFETKMRKLCQDSGIAVVFVSELPGTRLSGATQWLTSEKAMVILSLRHKTDDHFWFSFFHEAAHILLHGKRAAFLDEYEAYNENKREYEKEADNFAASVLIPEDLYESLKMKAVFSPETLQDFARKVSISPGIVVGRLQHDGLLPWNSPLNRLKQRFELIEASG
jgi:addiction module HigA family antidote